MKFQTTPVTFTNPMVTPFVLRGPQYYSAYVHTDGMYGYAVLLDFSSANFFVICLRFSDMAVCVYSNVARSNQIGKTFDANYSYCRFLGNRLFLCYNGHGLTYYVQLPQAFTPNGWFVVSSYVFTPAPPCGDGVANAAYYDAARKIVLQSFIHAYPLATDYYASIYAANGSGLTFLEGGYIGNFPNGVNPLVKGGNAALPSFGTDVDSSYYTSTGEICSSGQFYYSPNRLTQIADISYGNLHCGVPNTQTFVESADLFTFNNPGTLRYPNCGCCTPWAVTYAAADFRNPYAFMLANASGGVYAPCSGVESDSYGIFVVDSGIYYMYGSAGTVTVSKATGANSTIKMPPVVQPPTAYSLLNWHRPISTRGLFRT